jgi:MFS family permease
MRRPARMPPERADAVAEQFRLRSVAIAAFGPATLFGLAEGAMLPVIALSSIDRGASTAVAALTSALLGVGSLVTNIPSGILATRIGERRSMLVAAAVAGIGLILCLVNLGRGGLSLVVFGSGVLLLGAASSVYTLARQSYLTEIVPREMRARALSTLGGTLRIGMFAGPFLAAGAEELWGLPGAYYVSLAAMTGAAVIVYRVPDLDKSQEHNCLVAASMTVRNSMRSTLANRRSFRSSLGWGYGQGGSLAHARWQTSVKRESDSSSRQRASATGRGGLGE